VKDRSKARPGGRCRLLLLCVSAFAAWAVTARAADLPSAPTADPTGLSYVCSGNEPFWRIEMNQAAAVLTQPGLDDIEEHVFQGRLDAFTYLDPPWSVWRGNKSGDGGGDLVVVTREETCLDTMADEAVFDHRAIVSFPEGHAATGCCNAVTLLDPAAAPPADPGAGSADDWTRLWPDVEQAIDACLATTRGDASTVVKAWPMNHGRIGVRLGGSRRERFDCIVIDGPNTVERIDPVAADAPALPGEGAPVFLPSQGPSQGDPPRVSCGRLGRVVDSRGVTAGYLHYRDGCAPQ
jgi:uncharacterized membrane protein